MEGFSNITCPEGGANFCTNGEPKDLKPEENDLISRGVSMFLFFFNFT